MPDVKRVTIQIRAASDRDAGQVSFGYYILEGDKLTMTDGDGKPFRRIGGDFVRHTLKPGEDPDTIARVLTRDVRKQLYGDSAGFNRRIEFPPLGIA